jgi:hypothetical protein
MTAYIFHAHAYNASAIKMEVQSSKQMRWLLRPKGLRFSNYPSNGMIFNELLTGHNVKESVPRFMEVAVSSEPTIQWVPGPFSLGVKRQGREADHSPPASAEVKKT